MITKSRTAKLAAGFVGFAMAVSAFVPAMASADTASDLQAQINSLLATISSLQAQLSASTGGSVSTGYTFNTNLTVGSTGADVLNLQKTLNMSADTKVANSGNGSPGMETSYFGPATKAAVSKFQVKYGITPTAGYVGPVTRAKLNTMGGSVVVPPVTPGTNPQGGSLSVTAGSQPSNSLAPQGAARVPFTTVVLSAGSSDVTVNSITVERVGLAQDAIFAGVVLVDTNAGMQIGIQKTLNSNHQAMVGEPFVVKAGTSKTVTIAGNMNSSLSSYAGQVAGLNVVAVNTSASVSGSLPISGAMHTVNASLTLGTATLAVSSYDPSSAQTKEIGISNYKFAGVRVTAGSQEQVRVWSVRWNQSGSASSNDLGNVKVYVDGIAYDTVVSSDGKYYSATFSGGILIDKGLSKDVYIQGDLVGSGASGRTVQFDLYKNTDLYMSGVTYGYGIIGTNPNGLTNTAASTATEFVGPAATPGTPFFSGSLVTVSAGTVTSIQKATSVAAQNIAVNVPNQVLGGFVADIKGEPITVQSMAFTIATSGTWASSGPITNITIVNENGAVVAGPVDEASTCTSGCTVTFTDSVTLPIGAHTYTLKGKIPTNAPNGGTVIVSATPSGWSNVTGQTTGNTISLSANGLFAMNTMTVKSASLTVSVGSSPAAQSIVPGGRVTFTNYQFDASNSGEDVRFGVFPVAYNRGAGSGQTFGAAASKMTSCQLYDGTTALNTGSNVVNPTETATTTTPNPYSITLDQQITIAKGTVKTLSLACNVSSSADNASVMQWGLTNGVSMTTTGVTSGADVSESLTTAPGSAMTVSTGSFTVAVDSSTSNYTTVAGGSTGVTIGTFKFRATNEPVNLTKIGLILSTSTPSDLTTVYLYQGATLLGTATFTGSATTATSTLNSALALAKDTDVLITIKADLANIGSSDTGTEGRLVKIDVTNAEGSGANSGTTLTVAGVTAGVNGVRVFKSFPTISSDTLSGTGVADGKLMRFKVTANNAGPVGIFQLSFTLATSGTASTNTQVTSAKLYAYTDSSYSLPASTAAGDGQFGATNGFTGATDWVSATLLKSAPTIVFQSTTNPLNVPAGATYYFELRASVGGVTTGSSVTTTLNGDSAYLTSARFLAGTNGPTIPFVSSTTGAVADGAKFIWSGNATSTAVFSSLDWANGFGISGLSSGGLSVTRSQ